jgi:hypothetical protein
VHVSSDGILAALLTRQFLPAPVGGDSLWGTWVHDMVETGVLHTWDAVGRLRKVQLSATVALASEGIFIIIILILILIIIVVVVVVTIFHVSRCEHGRR